MPAMRSGDSCLHLCRNAQALGRMNLQITKSRSVSARYLAKIASGEIEPDKSQAAVIEDLTQLEGALAHHSLVRRRSALSWIFGARATSSHPVRGLYIWGEVGRGKTMLMDLFFAAASVRHKRRVHFHEFMAEV